MQRQDVSTGSRWLVLAACAAALAIAAGPAAAQTAPSAQTDPLAQAGERLYVRYCAVCHGKSGRGDGPFAGILRTAPADLTTIAARRGGSFPDEELAQHVDGRLVPLAHGTREMPVWGRWLGEPMGQDMTRDEVVRGEILAMLTYVKTLQREAAPAK
jgi:mono/diheme cytochrome c family protein